MAACRVSAFQNRLILLNFPKDLSGIQCQIVRCQTSKPDINEESNLTEKDPVQELRDVCRLPLHLRQRMKHRQEFVSNIKDIDTSFLPEKKIKGFRRSLFGLYGFKSGIKPAEMWPSKKEVKEYDSEDRHWFEQPLEDMISRHKEEMQKKEKTIAERMKRVEENMEMMPKLIEKFRMKQKKLKEEEEIRMNKESEVRQEAREHFGFDIARHDPRYQEWLEQRKIKKKEEMKQKKREKKLKELNN